MTSISEPRLFSFVLVKYSIFVPKLGWTHRSTIPELFQLKLALQTCPSLQDLPHSSNSIFLLDTQTSSASSVAFHVQSNAQQPSDHLMSLVFSSQSYQSHQLEIVKKEQHCAFRWILIENNIHSIDSPHVDSNSSTDNSPKQFVKLQLKFSSIMECDVFYNTIQETLNAPSSSPLQPTPTISNLPFAPPVASSNFPPVCNDPHPLSSHISTLLETSEWKSLFQQCLENDQFFKLVDTLESYLRASGQHPQN